MVLQILTFNFKVTSFHNRPWIETEMFQISEQLFSQNMLIEEKTKNRTKAYLKEKLVNACYIFSKMVSVLMLNINEYRINLAYLLQDFLNDITKVEFFSVYKSYTSHMSLLKDS